MIAFASSYLQWLRNQFGLAESKFKRNRVPNLQQDMKALAGRFVDEQAPSGMTSTQDVKLWLARLVQAASRSPAITIPSRLDFEFVLCDLLSAANLKTLASDTALKSGMHDHTSGG